MSECTGCHKVNYCSTFCQRKVVPPPICPPCPLPTHRARLPTVPAPSSAAQSPVPLGQALLAVALDLMLAGTAPGDPPRL